MNDDTPIDEASDAPDPGPGGDDPAADLVWGTTSFAIGDGIGLVGERMIALIDESDDEIRDRLWALIVADASIAEVLDQLSIGGLAGLPDFGVVRVDESGRAVVRGRTRLLLEYADGRVDSLDAEGASTWKECQLDPDAMSVTLQLDDAPSSAPFAVLAGSVPATLIRRSLQSADPFGSSASGRWGRGPSGASESAEPADSVDQLAPVTVVNDGEAESAPDPILPVDDGLTGEPDGRHELADRAAGPDPAASGHSDEEQVADSESSPTHVVDPQPPAPPPDPLQTISGDLYEEARQDGLEPQDPPQQDEGGGYDFIYGHTVHRSVEDAAVRDDVEDQDNADAGLISAVPSSMPADDDAGSSDLAGDHDGLTLSRSQLEDMQEALATSGGPGTVTAVLCPAQHPNPVHSPTCRVCGATVVSTTPVSVQRPVLAQLTFATGERATLDKNVLIGRNPKVSGTVEGEFPYIIKFDQHGQGLSRTHAEISIEGWQMLVTDLHSTNGTEVTLPGQSSRRLHPGEPVAIELGTLIDFGDGIRCSVDPAP